MLNIYLLTFYFCNNIDIRAQFGKVFNSEGYFSQNCGIVLWTLVRNWGLLTFPFCPFPCCRKELGFCACVYGKGWELRIGKRMGWGWLCEGWGSCQGRERNSLPLDMTKHNSKGESRGAGSGRSGFSALCSFPGVHSWDPKSLQEQSQSVLTRAALGACLLLSKFSVLCLPVCLESSISVELQMFRTELWFGLPAKQTSPSRSHWLSVKLLSNLLKSNPSCLD